MPTYYSGNDLDGIRLKEDGDFWIVDKTSTVSNARIAFDFGATVDNTLKVQGIVASRAGDAVRALTGAHIEIDKGGQIRSGILGSNDGVSLEGRMSTIENSGLVYGMRAGVSVEQALSLRNSGLIVGGDYGISIDEKYNYIGFLVNSGDIIGGKAGLFQVSDVINSGTIEGEIGIVHGENDGTILNKGVITGTSGVAITGNFFTPDINLINRGIINGDAHLGEGDSLYIASRSGVIHGAVYGETDEDTLVGNSRDDTLDGGAQNDLLRGRGGNDLISGGTNADIIYGGNGDDTITGWHNDDVLYGGRGNDVLGDMDVRFSGYSSHQTMSGGSGNDTFLFDGLITATVLDFQNDIDTLVFSALYASSIDDILADAIELADGSVAFGFTSEGATYLVANTSKADLADDVALA